MPEGFFDPLPEGVSSKLPTRSGKFYDIEVYGDIYAEGGAISGDLDVTGDLNITGSLAITGDMDIVGDMYSNNWVSGGGTVPLSLPDALATTGWGLDGSAGTAQFESIYANGGALGNLTVNNELTVEDAITLSTGGVFRTADSGQRLEISNDTSNRIKYYSGDVDEEQEALLYGRVINGTGATRLIDFALLGGYINVNDQGAGLLIRSASADGTTFAPGVYVSDNPGGDPGTGSGLAPIFKVLSGIESYFTGNINIDAGKYIGFGSNYDDRLYQAADSDLRLSVAGVDRMRMLTSDVYLYASNGGTNRTRIFIDGNGNTDLSDNVGVVRGRISTQGFGLSDGSVSAPSLYFASDNNTGMYWYGTDGIAITAGGRIAARFNEVSSQVEVRLPDVYGNTSSSDPYVRISTTGLLRQDSSQRKLKKDINYYGVPLVRLPVVSYTQKNGDIERLGLIAEDMADVDPRLALYNDDDVPVDWDVKGAIAVLQRQIDELVKKQEACNCAV